MEEFLESLEQQRIRAAQQSQKETVNKTSK